MSCKMDLKELISIKLLVNTIINLIIMTVFASLTAVHFGNEIYLLIIYFLVPFMITNVINIGVMKLSKNKSNEIINITVTLLLNIVLLIAFMLSYLFFCLFIIIVLYFLLEFLLLVLCDSNYFVFLLLS